MLTTYMGIDPGVNGGIAAITKSDIVGTKLVVELLPLKDMTLNGIFYWLRDHSTEGEDKTYAVIEFQTPRATQWLDKSSGTGCSRNKKWKSSILRSTCILYGSYKELLALTITNNITLLEEVTPKKWHNMLSLPKQGKLSKSEYKGVLKEEAKRLYPDEKITLATADALLLAHYCKLVKEG